jgi:sugar lactone lactonase YvrE
MPSSRAVSRCLVCLCATLSVGCASRDQPAVLSSLPTARLTGQIEHVAAMSGAMPTGVTVSRAGRIFVNFPRWGDPVPFTVAELRSGIPVAYPSAGINRLDTGRAADSLISVQSVVVDPNDRLWILDTGSVNFAPVLPGGAKLMGIDLATNRVVRVIRFPPDVVMSTSYLNDVRFDLRQGAQGVAYITDSSAQGRTRSS